MLLHDGMGILYVCMYVCICIYMSTYYACICTCAVKAETELDNNYNPTINTAARTNQYMLRNVHLGRS